MKAAFEELNAELFSADPLEFVDTKKYPDRLVAGYEKTGLHGCHPNRPWVR